MWHSSRDQSWDGLVPGLSSLPLNLTTLRIRRSETIPRSARSDRALMTDENATIIPLELSSRQHLPLAHLVKYGTRKRLHWTGIARMTRKAKGNPTQHGPTDEVLAQF